MFFFSTTVGSERGDEREIQIFFTTIYVKNSDIDTMKISNIETKIRKKCNTKTKTSKCKIDTKTKIGKNSNTKTKAMKCEIETKTLRIKKLILPYKKGN